MNFSESNLHRGWSGYLVDVTICVLYLFRLYVEIHFIWHLKFTGAFEDENFESRGNGNFRWPSYMGDEIISTLENS